MTDVPGIQLRRWAASDKESLVRYANNRNIWINMMDVFPHPYTEEDGARWLARVATEQAKPTRLAIDLDGEAIGGVGVTPMTDVDCKTANISYWLGEPFWGRGIATYALKLLTAYAFANFDLERLQAGVFEWNPGSARVLEKAGYQFEGRLRRSIFKDGRIGDALFYARLRESMSENDLAPTRIKI